MQSLNRTIQGKLRVVHFWLGLIAGLFIVMMGLSGSLVVFRPIIESAAAPKMSLKATPSGLVNLARVEQSLAAVHPGAQIRRVTFPDSSFDPVLVQAETIDQQRVQEFFDGSSGQALGPKKKLRWLDWIADLHQNLLMGKTGRALTGVIRFALLLLSVSGSLSWLAGHRDWKRALSLPRKGPWRRLNYQAHKWAGLWANLLLIAASFTGIVLAYPDTFEQAIRALSPAATSGPPQPAEPASPVQGLLSLDEYVRVATASIPGGIVREVRLPGRGRSVVSVALWAPGDIRPKGTTVIVLAPASAKIISIERSAGLLSARGFIDAANAVHKSELGGLAVKLVWSLFGVAPLLLFLSGIQIWWHQRPLAPRRRDAPAEAADAASALVHK